MLPAMLSRGAALMLLGLLMGMLAAQLGLVGMAVLLWTGLTFIAVGVAYLCNLRGIFGKRPDGTLGAPHVLALLPFLALTWTTWHVSRRLSREPPVSVLSPRLRLARRLLPHELPADVDLVVDLTAEFTARIRPPRYLNLRILDGGLPDPAELRRVLDALPTTGTTLVHCAQGHGRTAMFSACLLVQHDDRSADAAIAEVLAARPLARMTRAQRAFVTAYASAWIATRRM